MPTTTPPRDDGDLGAGVWQWPGLVAACPGELGRGRRAPPRRPPPPRRRAPARRGSRRADSRSRRGRALRRRSRPPADARSATRRRRPSRGAPARRCRAPAGAATTVGRPTVRVPVLSKTTAVTSAARWSASPPLISSPASAPRPVATITAVGTARPIAHGQAMISTATAVGEGAHQAALAAGDGPDHHGERRQRHHRRHEDRGDTIGKVLDRRPRRLRVLHQTDDLRQRARRPGSGGPHDQRPGAVHRPAHHPGLGGLQHRHRLAGEHRLVHRRTALDDHAVHRQPFSRPHHDEVADGERGDVAVGLAAVGEPHPRDRRLQGDEPAQAPAWSGAWRGPRARGPPAPAR